MTEEEKPIELIAFFFVACITQQFYMNEVAECSTTYWNILELV